MVKIPKKINNKIYKFSVFNLSGKYGLLSKIFENIFVLETESLMIDSSILFQGHIVGKVPIINPDNILIVKSLYFLNKKLRIFESVIKPINDPIEKNTITLSIYTFSLLFKNSKFN